MTREQWKDRLPLIQGFVDGKDVYHHHNGCHLETSPEFDDAVIKYRVVDPPQPPKLVPWTIETCPIGSVIRRKNDEQRCLLLSCQQTAASVQTWGWLRYGTMLEEFEHLKPDGTWGPCGIEVTPLEKAPDIT